MMKEIFVDRWASTPYGVFSRFYVKKAMKSIFSCHSLETTNKKEKPNCIEVGSFEADLSMYYAGDGVGGKKDYAAYELRDVPGFKEVKIHIANYYNQLEACIAPGLSVDWSTDRNIPMVTSSAIAFERFMNAMDHDLKCLVHIRWMDGRLANGIY